MLPVSVGGRHRVTYFGSFRGRLLLSQSPTFSAASATRSFALSPPNSLKILRKRSL